MLCSLLSMVLLNYIFISTLMTTCDFACKIPMLAVEIISMMSHVISTRQDVAFPRDVTFP